MLQTFSNPALLGEVDKIFVVNDSSRGQIISIAGWFFHSSGELRRQSFELNGAAPFLSKKMEREDLLERFPGFPQARDSGFILTHHFSVPAGKILHLHVNGELENGEQFSDGLFLISDRFPQLIAPAGSLELLDPYGSPDARAALLSRLKFEYELFRMSNERLKFRTVQNPELSIVIVTYNRAELTWRCLRSLQQQGNPEFEIIIVDNGSSDSSRELFSRLEGVRVIQNHMNAHFLISSNIGALHSKGENILFLNNDTIVFDGAIEHACKTLNADPTIGAIGAKLIRPDGLLQEAGCTVFGDGSTAGNGNGRDPWADEYLSGKEVDYCSAAFLLTPAKLFSYMGSFDQRYFPAYYEDADYCLRLRESGNQVKYEPRSVVLHFGSASNESFSAASNLMRRNRDIFVRRHSAFLKTQPSALQTLSGGSLRFAE